MAETNFEVAGTELNSNIDHYTDISNLISTWSGRDVIDAIDARKYDNGLVTIDIVAHYTASVGTGNSGTFILDSSIVPAYTHGIGFMVSTNVCDGFLTGSGNTELSFNHPALNSGQYFYVSCKWKL